MTWHTFPTAPFPVCSSVIFPEGAGEPSAAGGGEDDGGGFEGVAVE